MTNKDSIQQDTERHLQNVISHAFKTVWVTFQREGIHKYPQALTDPKLEDVSFLGYPHRHIFHFRVEIRVHYDDRDIEFILFKRELQSFYDKGILQLNNKSCEMICDDLARYILQKYPGRKLTISVSEDNENGATATYYD